MRTQPLKYTKITPVDPAALAAAERSGAPRGPLFPRSPEKARRIPPALSRVVPSARFRRRERLIAANALVSASSPSRLGESSKQI